MGVVEWCFTVLRVGCWSRWFGYITLPDNPVPRALYVPLGMIAHTVLDEDVSD